MHHLRLPSRWPQGGQQGQCVLYYWHLTGNQRAGPVDLPWAGGCPSLGPLITCPSPGLVDVPLSAHSSPAPLLGQWMSLSRPTHHLPLSWAGGCPSLGPLITCPSHGPVDVPLSAHSCSPSPKPTSKVRTKAEKMWRMWVMWVGESVGASADAPRIAGKASPRSSSCNPYWCCG